MKNAMDSGAGDSVGLRQLTEALSLSSIPQDAGAIELERFASNMTAFELGPAHSGAHPLDDQVSFELCNGADDHDDGAAQWTTGIDLFAETDKLDIEMIEFVQDFEEVFHRPGQTVGGPNQDHIEAAAAGVLHHFVQTRAPGFGTADLIGILPDDFVIALNRHLLEIIELGFGVLVEGGNS